MKIAVGKGFLIALFVFPATYLLLYSISSQWFFPKLIPEISLTHWRTIFKGTNGLAQSLLLSFVLSAAVSFAATTLAFFTSRYLFLSNKADLWKKMALLPFIISPIIYAISVNFFFNYLNISASSIGVSIALMFVVYPYAILLFSGFWNAKHRATQQLVATLGGNAFLQWRSGIWPQAKQVFYTCLFQSFLIAWFDFGFTQYIGLGKVKTLTIQVYQLVAEGNPYVAAAASVLLIIPPLLMLFVNRKLVFKRL